MTLDSSLREQLRPLGARVRFALALLLSFGYGTAGLFSGYMALLMSAFAFDAPDAGQHPQTWMMIALFLSLPASFLAAVAAFWAWPAWASGRRLGVAAAFPLPSVALLLMVFVF